MNERKGETITMSRVPATGGRTRLAKIIYGCTFIIPLMFLATPHGQAAAIVLGTDAGVYNINNIGGQMVGVSNACINWSSTITCPTTPPAPSYGDQGTGDGGASPVFTTVNGTIKDLVASFGFPVVGFETAGSNQGLVTFDLTSLAAAVAGPGNNCTTFAVGAICVPPGSSFTLDQTGATSISISLQVNLEAYTGGSSGTNYSAATPYVGVFTTQISGTINNLGVTADTIPNILAFLNANPTNAVTSTWSATESPVGAPEPMTFFLMGSGLLGAAVLGKRFRAGRK
jgi:hypothetical protein